MATEFNFCPQDINICRVRGDTVPMVLTIQDENGVAVDITGASFLLTVNEEEEPTDDTLQLFQLVGVVTDGPAGQVTFSIGAVDADQTPNTYYFDLQMTASGGEVQTLAKGQFRFEQDITK